MRNNFPFIGLVLGPKEFGDCVLKIRMMNNKDRCELFSFLVREEIDVVVFNDKAKLFLPLRDRGKPLKKKSM